MSDQEIIGPDDEFDDPFSDEAFDEPRAGMSGRAKLFATGAVVIGLVAVVAVGWFAFQEGIRSGAEEAAPVVRAATEPFKRKPDDPGGLDVPHQDKLVFNRLAPGQVQEPVERLLPPPEEPAERPQAPEIEVVQSAPVDGPQAAPETVVVPERIPAQTVSPEQSTEQAVVVAPPPPPPPAPVVAPELPAPPPAAAKPSPKPEVAPKPVQKPAATASAGGSWKIQLASVSSRASAESEWKRMQSKNNDLLGPLSLNVQTITLDRGTFFRIQAGSVASRAAADDLCGKLKSRNQDCLVVAP